MKQEKTYKSWKQSNAENVDCYINLPTLTITEKKDLQTFCFLKLEKKCDFQLQS